MTLIFKITQRGIGNITIGVPHCKSYHLGKQLAVQYAKEAGFNKPVIEYINSKEDKEAK